MAAALQVAQGGQSASAEAHRAAEARVLELGYTAPEAPAAGLSCFYFSMAHLLDPSIPLNAGSYEAGRVGGWGAAWHYFCTDG